MYKPLRSRNLYNRDVVLQLALYSEIYSARKQVIAFAKLARMLPDDLFYATEELRARSELAHLNMVLADLYSGSPIV